MSEVSVSTPSASSGDFATDVAANLKEMVSAETKQPDQSTKTEPEKKPEPTKVEEKKVEEKTEDTALETALRALRRDKVPDKLLNSMGRDDLVAWGEARAKNQADVDGAYQELKTLKTKDAKPAGDAERPGADKPSETTTEKPFSVDVKALAKPFEEEFGAKGMAAVESALGQIVTVFQKELEDRDDALDSLVDMYDDMAFHRVQNELGERFPELSKPESAEKWRTKVEKLTENGGYLDSSKTVIGRYRAAGLDACKILFSEDKNKSDKSEELDSHSVTPPNGRGVDRGTTLSDDEQLQAEWMLRHKIRDRHPALG